MAVDLQQSAPSKGQFEESGIVEDECFARIGLLGNPSVSSKKIQRKEIKMRDR